ncbi:MAG: IS110 family transposase [Phycisphaerae bacterium]|nr:IS110 family transposase [Phycisphaerae bacterium]
MINVGMDVHSVNTVLHFFDPQAAEDRQHRSLTVPTTAKDLTAVLRPLKGQCRVAYEVGVQAQWVASVVRPLAAEVQVANSSRIPWLFRDGRKNDKLDAKKLATLLYLRQLPTVHLPAADVSAWRALINHRRSLIKRRTMLKNQVRSILRAFQERCPHKSCWTKVGRVWLKSLNFDSARNIMMNSLLWELETLELHIDKVEEQLNQIAASQPAVALLRTIPGIGPRSAEAIVAFADQVSRFRNRKEFASYFGMTPTQDSSGLVDRHGHISKRGPSVVRWVLVEAVHRVIQYCPAMRAFFERIWQGKKDRYKKAIVAVGRKVLAVAFAMLRENKAFDPSRVLPNAA